MGFRSAFVNHKGVVTCHSEIFLHVMDRFTCKNPISILLNEPGGSVQIWESLVPEGSEIIGLSSERSVSDNVHIGDVADRSWLEEILGLRVFDLIIDSSGAATGSLWPWLRVNGFLVIENYEESRIVQLLRGMLDDSQTWIPYEEILGIQFYPNLVMVEKRHPRVVPYLDIIVGEDDVFDREHAFLDAGAKRVVLPE